uniref:Uncharacterized protein n=1 Tax=Lysobacter sp. ATCC 53042 TaxID=324869 RepID=F8TUC4_9GAMM|nr:unknown [Lysobacter sp. ATCC 53042]
MIRPARCAMPATTFKGGGTGQIAATGRARSSGLPACGRGCRVRSTRACARAAASAHKPPRAENPSPRTAGRTADAA